MVQSKQNSFQSQLEGLVETIRTSNSLKKEALDTYLAKRRREEELFEKEKRLKRIEKQLQEKEKEAEETVFSLHSFY